MPSSILDAVDGFLSLHSGPWGLQSTRYYDEPPLHQYDQHVPPPVPQSSTLDVFYTVFIYLSAVAMICAALTPIYLAFESQIWTFLEPFTNLMRAIHEYCEDSLPLDINRYDIFECETTPTTVAQAEEAPHPTPAMNVSLIDPRLRGTVKADSALPADNAMESHDAPNGADSSRLQSQDQKSQAQVSEIKDIVPAAVTEAIHQQTALIFRSGLAGFREIVVEEVLDKIPPPSTRSIEVEDLQQKLVEIKLHSTANYEKMMQEFKMCHQELADIKKRQNEEAHHQGNADADIPPTPDASRVRLLEEENSRLKGDLQGITTERDEVSALYWPLFRRMPEIHRQYIGMGKDLLQISHKEHVKVLDTLCKAAIDADDKYEKELAAKDDLIQQLKMQHQGDLVAKDQSARQAESKHAQIITRVTTAYENLKQQRNSDGANNAKQREDEAAAYAAEKDKYVEEYTKIAEEVDDAHGEEIDMLQFKHAKEIDMLRSKHAAEKGRLELRAKKLSDKCKAVNLARKTVEQQNTQATTVLQLKEAEAALRHLTRTVPPAMKRLARSFNEQSVVLRDHLQFANDLWHGYLHEVEGRMKRTVRQDLAEGAELYLGLDTRGGKIRDDIFFPIVDLKSLLGIFDLPGVRQAGDPPRITSLAWGAMQPAFSAPVETFIEWLVEEDFTEERWQGLRELAYKLAKISSPYNIREILAKCHDLRRSDADQQ